MINKYSLRKQLVGALATGLSLMAPAWAANAGGPDTAPPAATTPPAVQNLFHCPPIAALTKDPNSRVWSAPGGWKSFDLSFVDKVTSFSGAQWRGTNVGQIFCVYRGEISTDFPIVLAYGVLTYLPQGGKWSANLGGYKNCETPNQEECPFSIRLKPDIEDIYQQAEKLKTTAPKSSRPGF
jgi:hypothetical protein